MEVTPPTNPHLTLTLTLTGSPSLALAPAVSPPPLPPTRVQLTDFENAAFTAFIVLASRDALLRPQPVHPHLQGEEGYMG